MVKRLWTAWSIHPIRNDKQMKNILLCLFIVFSATIQAQKIKVACVGNSVTYGHGIENREKNSYRPAHRWWATNTSQQHSENRGDAIAKG